VTEGGGANALLYYGSKRTHAVRLELDFRQGDKSNRYVCELRPTTADGLTFFDETVGFRRMRFADLQAVSLGQGHAESLLREAAKAGNVTAKTVNYWLARVACYDFRDVSFFTGGRTAARSDDNQYFRVNGSNLAAFLLRLERSEQEEDRTAFTEIQEWIRRLAPSVTALRPTVVEGATPGVRLDWEDERGARLIAAQMSEGALRALLVITALLQPIERRPKFICFDEPELGLHPEAIETLMELIRVTTERSQVFMSTHSPTIAERVRPEEAVIVERCEGQSVLSQLNGDEYDAWLAAFRRD
jgi:predicted ATPase